MSDPFKNCLYHTCSPTLRKVKPSNLFTLHKERCPSWKQDLEECRRTLQRFGYGMAVMQDNERYLVVMVYHIASLQRCLNQKELREWLKGMGYESALPLEGKLALLGERFRHSSFPHEIGLFLGYPIDDVRGFIANKGKNSKYTGEWKVYGDLPHALRLFASYQDSRRCVMAQDRRGMNLSEILGTC